MAVPGHGRQYYRLAPGDFACPDGLSPAWPLRAGELDPWYAFVERRLGLAGMHDNVPWLPDGELACALNPSSTKAALQQAVTARWPYARPARRWIKPVKPSSPCLRRRSIFSRDLVS